MFFHSFAYCCCCWLFFHACACAPIHVDTPHTTHHKMLPLTHLARTAAGHHNMLPMSLPIEKPPLVEPCPSDIKQSKHHSHDSAASHYSPFQTLYFFLSPLDHFLFFFFILFCFIGLSCARLLSNCRCDCVHCDRYPFVLHRETVHRLVAGVGTSLTS